MTVSSNTVPTTLQSASAFVTRPRTPVLVELARLLLTGPAITVRAAWNGHSLLHRRIFRIAFQREVLLHGIARQRLLAQSVALSEYMIWEI